MKQLSKLLSISVFFALTSSCAESDRIEDHDPIDRDVGLTRGDFKKLHDIASYEKPDGPTLTANVLEPPLPDLAEILAAPKPPKVASTQLVTVAVTDDVPLKDVLVELGRLADIDIEIDSGITGGISFRAKERPFNEVIERIANMAGLRYRVENNVLRVERDTAYIETYPLDMLNITRQSSGSITTGGGSGGSGGGSSSGSSSGGSGGGGGSSNSSITAESASDFWEKFEESITRILGFQSSTLVSSTSVAAQPVLPGPDGSTPPVAAVPGSATGNSSTAGTFFSLNRQAGTLTISGTERQHDMVKQFLRVIESNISSQVLIEAKIVEVTLNDKYQTGINWTKLGPTGFALSGDLDPVIATNPTTSAPAITFLKDNFLGGVDLSGAVSLLSEFGTTRALSSPRLNAMNNQQAVLSFVENFVFFDVSIDVTAAVPASGTSPAIPAEIEVESEQQEAPIGIVLTLQPSINKETNEVTLSVRPTLTKLVSTVADPGFEIGKARALSELIASGASSDVINSVRSVTSNIPQLEVRELDSILKVKSGQIMVIGGLLEDSVTNVDTGVPGVDEVPYLGNLFKGVEKTNSKKELVILIRATIVDSAGYMDHADKSIYKKFIQDPRPIEFPERQY
ncbi:MAG: secretin N-terminal domain-containing protein [Rickettsiales bacterium]